MRNEDVTREKRRADYSADGDGCEAALMGDWVPNSPTGSGPRHHRNYSATLH